MKLGGSGERAGVADRSRGEEEQSLQTRIG
jgi:hypothetical protein